MWRAGCLLLVCTLSSSLSAQEWNSPVTRALVDRAIARRQRTESDSGLQRYHGVAQGTVLFLTQVGPDPDAAPRLIKADQLSVEVYWEAPNRSKQIVRRWRDRAFLPTDISYHRDHLGIVTNDFGNAIRLGEGDEVRDVIHPLAAVAPAFYDYALADSLVIRGGDRPITVYEVMVRPRDATLPLVVGTLYLETRSATLVRFRFGFTPAAYLDHDLEDITVVLERALFERRYWLPFRQEIEIRRRTAWLDFPFRTVIRGRWEIGDYDLERPIPPAVFAGGPYGGLRRPAPGDSAWVEPLDSAVARSVGPVARADVESVRRDVVAQLGPAGVSVRPPARLAFGSLSELVHVNRVQGLALGVAAGFSVRPLALEIRPSIGYGTSDGRVTGGLGVSRRAGPVDLSVEGGRRITDFGEWPVISGALNSIMAQESGADHGDYVLLDAARLTAGVRLGDRFRLEGTALVEDSKSVVTAASPASGSYAPNPALGAGRVEAARLLLRRSAPTVAARGVDGSVGLEFGSADVWYTRVTMGLAGRVPLGAGSLRAGVRAGFASQGSPAYRSFALGGRGTLVGEPFRAYGGQEAVLLRLDWQIPVPVPELRLGNFASTGPQGTLAPFVALGWAESPPAGLPWSDSGGGRPVVGVASELLFGVVRIEAGWAVRSGRFGLTIDASPPWWPIL